MYNNKHNIIGIVYTYPDMCALSWILKLMIFRQNNALISLPSIARPQQFEIFINMSRPIYNLVDE